MNKTHYVLEREYNNGEESEYNYYIDEISTAEDEQSLADALRHQGNM